MTDRPNGPNSFKVEAPKKRREDKDTIHLRVDDPLIEGLDVARGAHNPPTESAARDSEGDTAIAGAAAPDSEPDQTEVSMSQAFTAPDSPDSSSDSRSDTKPLANRDFGRYELLLKMGAGGMATIYLARMRGLETFEKNVVIKKIHNHLADEQRFVDMFLDEARISAMIHHPNVVQIFDLGKIEETLYIAMEYVDGVNLGQLLKTAFRVKSAAFGWDCAVRIVADAAAGLHAAHELTNAQGKSLEIVHRDVSPQNILVSFGGHIKIVDFGIAYAAERISHTQTGMLKGKLAYMSPEQAGGKILDRRSDVFSLGIVLWEAVCRKRLFRSKTEAETIVKVSAAAVPKPRSIRPTIPVELEAIILKALAMDPADRYSTAAELKQALEGLLALRSIVVGSEQIGKLTTHLFQDQKQVREQQLREQSALSFVGQAYQFESRNSVQMESEDVSLGDVTLPPEDREEPPRRAASALPLIIGVLGIFAVIGAAVFVVVNLKSPTPVAGKTSGVSTDPSAGKTRIPPPSDIVELTFFITPVGAALFLDGKEHVAHKKDLKRVLRIKRGESPIKIKVVAAGYLSKMGNVLPVQDQLVTVNLLREGAVSPNPNAGESIQITGTRRRRRRRRRRRASTRMSAETMSLRPRMQTMRPRSSSMGAMRDQMTRGGGAGAVDF